MRNLREACELVNRIAPEHLELSVEKADALLPRIRHAGAIFLGRDSSEALGDYCAGPNHVLPTSRTARFFSPLGVYDFQKRTSIIRVSRKPRQARLSGPGARAGVVLFAHAWLPNTHEPTDRLGAVKVSNLERRRPEEERKSKQYANAKAPRNRQVAKETI